MVSVVIHSNPTLANQIESASWVRTGFLAHGIDAEITADKHKEADVHVIQGPHYCYSEWLGKPNVIWLNRAFYGHPRFDLSLGWLRPDGSRDFKCCGATVPNGTLPVLKPRKDSRRCAVVFGDYGSSALQMVTKARQEYDSVFFRPHPAQSEEDTPVMTLKGDLAAVWEIADVAIGGTSTALVEAIIEGLHVESTDPHHVCQSLNGDRQAWLTELSWCQWSHRDIQSGKFWEHLC